MLNYFQKFNLKEDYNINLKELDKQYFQAQASIHPDQQNSNINESIIINDIYKKLKDDYERADHLLKLKGININEQVLKEKADPQILKKSLEDRMQLEEIEKELPNFFDAKIKEKNIIVRNIGKYFELSDYENVIKAMINLRYLNKLIENIKEKMSHL